MSYEMMKEMLDMLDIYDIEEIMLTYKNSDDERFAFGIGKEDVKD